MKRIIVSVLLLLFSVTRGSEASFLYTPRTPRSTGIGGGDVILDGGSIFVSPTALTASRLELKGGFSKPFGLDGISLEWVQGEFSAGRVSAGAGVQKFSATGYVELVGLLAIAIRRKEGEAFGISARFMESRAGEWNPDAAFGLDLGLKKKWRSITAGIALRNINFPGPQYFGPVPEVIMGLGVAPGQGLLLALELERELGQAYEPRIGVEVEACPGLFLRGGMFLEPTRIASGIGLSFGKMQFDYSYLTHEELGGTQEFSTGVKW